MTRFSAIYKKDLLYIFIEILITVGSIPLCEMLLMFIFGVLHTHTHTYIYIHIHTHIHTYIHTHTHIYMYMYTYIHNIICLVNYLE